MNTWYEWMKRMQSRNTSYPSWQGFNCRGVWEFAHMHDWEVSVNWDVTKESEGRTMGSETVLREEEPQHPSNGSNTVSEITVCDRAHNISLNRPQCPGCSEKSGMQENKRCRGKGTCQEDGLKSPGKGDFLQDSTDRQSSISVRGSYFQIYQFKFQIGDAETAVC